MNFHNPSYSLKEIGRILENLAISLPGGPAAWAGFNEETKGGGEGGAASANKPPTPPPRTPGGGMGGGGEMVGDPRRGCEVVGSGGKMAGDAGVWGRGGGGGASLRTARPEDARPEVS